MSELVTMIQAVAGLMSHSETTDAAVLRKRIVRLHEEGIDTKILIAALIARGHEKEAELMLSGGSLDSLPLTISDLDAVERTLGVNDITPENRAAWEKKFKEGRAKFWCPQCGYAGNGEFRNGTSIGHPNFVICCQCSYFDDSRYFTRSWTPEEQAASEAERQARRAAADAKRLEDDELRRQRDAQAASVRSEAVQATREIELHQWLLQGDDEDSFSWDEHDAGREIRTVTALMLLPTRFGGLPIPADDVVAFFKQNMKDSDDTEASELEFNRCAQTFSKMTMEANNEN